MKDFGSTEEDRYEVVDTESLVDKSDGIVLRFFYLLLNLFRKIKNFLYRIEELIYFLTDPSSQYNIKLTADIEYYSGSDKHHHKHKLNLYFPQHVDPNKSNTSKYPIVIHIHGGGWARGDRYSFPPSKTHF